MSLKIKEFQLGNGYVLNGVEEESGSVYFSLQALAKACGFTIQQAKDLKKAILNEEGIKDILEWKVIPTKSRKQYGWTIADEKIAILVMRFPKLSALNEAYNNDTFFHKKKEVVSDLDNIFPVYRDTKEFIAIKSKVNYEGLHIRDFKLKIQLSKLSKICNIDEDSLINYIRKNFISQFYDENYRDFDFEGLILLKEIFMNTKELEKIAWLQKEFNDSLIEELYKKISIEINNQDAYKLCVLSNPMTGLVKVVVTKRIDKRIKENAGGNVLSLLYESVLITNAFTIKKMILEDFATSEVLNEWLNVKEELIIKRLKQKYEKMMTISKPTV